MYHAVQYDIVHEVRYSIVSYDMTLYPVKQYDIVLNHTIRYCTISYKKILYLI